MKRERLEQLPIYKKAVEIVQFTDALIKTLPEDSEMLLETKAQFIREDAHTVLTKIAGAVGTDLYDLKMENAAIIRKSARELYVTAGSLRFEPDFKDSEYVELLRATIEEFRLLFIDWVATFDPWNYIIDRWGLFNPPGISVHDKDPGDEIPFNPKEFLDGIDLEDDDFDEED